MFLVLVFAILAMLVLFRGAAIRTGYDRGSLAERLGYICRNFASDIGEVNLAVRPTFPELRSALETEADKLRDLRVLPNDKRGDTYADDVRHAIDTIHQLDGELDARERALPPTPQGPAAAFDHIAPEMYRTAGDEFVNSDVYKEAQSRGRSLFAAGYVEDEIRGGSLREHERRALVQEGSLTITYGADAGSWRPLGTPIAPPPRQQRLFIRDVLNVIQTGLGAVPYIKELNPAVNEGGASAVAEGLTKPEITLAFTPALAPIVKIAAWVPVTEEILEDAPTLAGYINTRLSYMLDLREEQQVLNGSGVAPQMTGIRKDPNIQTQTTVASDYPAVIGLAIGKVENVDLMADFVATNPLDFWVAVTTRHANAFDNGRGGPFSAPAVLAGLTWGTTAVRTRSMESGKALVGSSMGATIAERQGVTIRIGNQHSDYFVNNKVVVLAERREGLLIQRPDAFCECTVPTS